MNKTIRNLAIAALFIFPGLSGFPQAVQQAAASAAPVFAQMAQASRKPLVQVERCRRDQSETILKGFGDRER